MNEKHNNGPLPKKEKNSVAPFARDIVVDEEDGEEEDGEEEDGAGD